MMVKTRSASVALNDFPRIESNFVYTNLDRKNLLLMGSINVPDLFFVKICYSQWQGSKQRKMRRKNLPAFPMPVAVFIVDPLNNS